MQKRGLNLWQRKGFLVPTPFLPQALFETSDKCSGARGPPQFLKKRSENAWANENLSCGFPSTPGIAPGLAPRVAVFVLLESWDAIPRMEFESENGISNSKSRSENIPKLSESSENGLFTPRAFFLKLGLSPLENALPPPKTPETPKN